MNKQTTDYEKVKKSGGCCCTGKDQNHTEVIEPTTQSTDEPLLKLAVKGASCGGCVGKIERALQSVSGVEKAAMNLSTGTAIISGDVVIETLIRALNNVGFPATKAE